MWVKGPVHKQPPPDQVLVRHSSPVTAVETVIAVIAQRKIPIARHRERLISLRQELAAEGITAIRRSRRHHAFKTVALRFLAVDVEKWRINAQLVARQTGQSFDVKRRARNRVLANFRNIICPENKNIAVMWLNKVVAEFVDEHLVARVDCAPCNNFAA